MRLFHSEDKERIDMAVNAALEQVSEWAEEHAKEAVERAMSKVQVIRIPEPFMEFLTSEDKRRLALFSAFVSAGVRPDEAMKFVISLVPAYSHPQSHEPLDIKSEDDEDDETFDEAVERL